MLKLVIIDDSPDIRTLVGMQIRTSPDFAVSAEGGTAAAAVELSRRLRPTSCCSTSRCRTWTGSRPCR
ncbi:MAG TPA: hypothetical protein VHU88_05360 [Sporichthyaceae bacterium]|nr:hypothetical protein [Sporichthyaceae bacterium]